MFNFVTGYVMGSRQAGKVAGMSASANAFSGAASSKLHDVNDRLDRQLDERILEMDRLDGAADGRAVRQTVRCPKCDSAVVQGMGHCQICGTEVGEVSPFAGI